jgi:phage regulator Rha-like protein
VRASVAAQVDAHTITLEAGTAAIREAAAEFLSQIEALANAEAQARQMRAAQQEQRQAAAQQAEQNDEAARAVLLGIAAYYQTRANMDAAGSAAIAAQPPITHTTCQTNPLFGTVTCTHTPY